MTSRRVRRLVLRTASWARIGTFLSAGMAMVARMPMIAMTTISSRRVNPCSRARNVGVMSRLLLSSPLAIRHTVETHSHGHGVDVVDVLATPGGGIGLVLIAAHPP